MRSLLREHQLGADEPKRSDQPLNGLLVACHIGTQLLNVIPARAIRVVLPHPHPPILSHDSLSS